MSSRVIIYQGVDRKPLYNYVNFNLYFLCATKIKRKVYVYARKSRNDQEFIVLKALVTPFKTHMQLWMYTSRRV